MDDVGSVNDDHIVFIGVHHGNLND